ncbi:MAG: helix-turn-helix transcriptional regulator [Dehalococcoidia bacterium]
MARDISAEVNFTTTVKVEGIAEDEPCYVISVAARMVGVHAQTLRYYERIGLVFPARSRGNIRMYSPQDVHRARWIKALIDDLGINLAGVDVIMRMSTKMAELEERVGALTAKLEESTAT